MAELTQDNTAPCNTLLRGRNWNFTWNNYQNNDIDTIKKYCGKNDKYIIGMETGSQGTQHLQGCIEFENARTFASLHKQFPHCHWEITKNRNAIRNYCMKENMYITNINKPLDEIYDDYMNEEYKNVIWKPWQSDVFKLIDTKPDKRKIYWFWDMIGNVGKSYLVKYINWKYNSIIVNGKQTDIFHGFRTYLEYYEKYPNICIIDIPRCNQSYVCYGTIEKLKDGLFFSGKYESGQIRLIPLHIIIFANFPPDKLKMSEDRWEIEYLDC